MKILRTIHWKVKDIGAETKIYNKWATYKIYEYIGKQETTEENIGKTTSKKWEPTELLYKLKCRNPHEADPEVGFRNDGKSAEHQRNSRRHEETNSLIL